MHFSEFKITPDLLKGIEEAGYAECTEVQRETLLHTLSGRDVFVQSQTGTGKTAAFLVSLFELMERGAEKEKALIISPTRELAVQIAEEAKLLSTYLDYSIATMFGGVGFNGQMRAIADGIDLLIGTPGRLIDMSNRRMLNLRQYGYVVIDEADRMFDMGFVHDVQTILRRLPGREARQTMLFSATLGDDVKRLAALSMNDPAEVHIAAENVTVDTINQLVYHVGSSQKTELLIGILKKYGTGRALIFVNMKHMAEEVAERLRGNGFDAEHLTGDLAQRQRQRRIDRFKNNELPVLVATDVAARGIHVEDLELVVNYDIPMHSENYVHRIGRTARLGKSGYAITLACETYVEFLAPVEAFIRMKIPSAIAEEDLYLPDATAGKKFGRARRSSGRKRDGGFSTRCSGPRRSASGRTARTERTGRHGRRSGRDGSFRGKHPPRADRSTGTPHRETPPRSLPGGWPVHKAAEKKLPSSHGRDSRSFDKHRHHEDGSPSHGERPRGKRGLFSKVMSLFR
ncbi:MAG: DEAD/DEAH box helicase [Chitinispirillaceae bacterium]|nr:DEAD/DEAH box helicase [Chitinispirillaceae bacterium]